MFMFGLRFFLFCLFASFAIVMAHDLYLFLNQYPLDSVPQVLESDDFSLMAHLSDLGALWARYAPENLKWIAGQLDGEQRKMFSFVLTQKAVFVFAAIIAVVYALLFLLNLIKIVLTRQSDQPMSGKERINRLLGRNTGGKYKYSRK